MKTLCIFFLSLFCRSVSIVRPGSSPTICSSRDLSRIEFGRFCRKPCSSDSDCRGRLKRCRCDDVCGMSCFNPNAECARLPVILFGRVIYRSRNTRYRSQAEYRCHPGWVLRGNAVRSCRSDKKWSGTAARCLILRCSEPVAPDYGFVVSEGIDFTYRSRIEFACDIGYENIGSTWAVCNENATWEGMANCTGIKLKCGQTVNRISTSPPRSVGRVVEGIDADRSWPWQALIMVNNGKVYNSFASSFAGGSLINQHWVLTAAHIFDRYSNIENWTKRFVVAVGIFRRPDNTRSKIDSNVIVFQPRNIVVHDRFDRSDRHGRSNYDYDVALIRVGIELRTIKENGEWIWTDSAPEFNGTIPLSTYVNPICLPCSNSCISIENYLFQNGSRLINENDSEGVKCFKKGKWLANHYTKDRAPMFVTGFYYTDLTRRVMPFELQQTTEQIQPDTICKIAVNKIADETLLDVRYTDRMICARPETSKVSDVCSGSSGGPLMRKYEIPNTSDSCWIQVGIVSFGYGCGKVDRTTGFRYPGFYTDVSKVQSWIDITIGEIKCPGFVVENGRLVPQRSVYAIGSTVNIECNAGYLLNGTSSQTCSEDGPWVNGQPRCIVLRCNEPVAPDHGSVNHQGMDFIYRSRVEFNCNQGYENIGSNSAVCNENATWQGTANCIVIQCTSFRVAEGRLIPQQNVYATGTTVSIECNEGFRLNGINSRRCSQSGNWVGEIPRCRVIQCTSFRVAEGRLIPPQNAYPTGSTVSIECNEGFRLNGINSRSCSRSGDWVGEIPTCTLIQCTSFRMTEGRLIPQQNAYATGTTVSIECNEGFRLNGINSRSCSWSGDWVGEIPRCTVNLECDFKTERTPTCGFTNLRNGWTRTPVRQTRLDRQGYIAVARAYRDFHPTLTSPPVPRNNGKCFKFFYKLETAGAAMNVQIGAQIKREYRTRRAGWQSGELNVPQSDTEVTVSFVATSGTVHLDDITVLNESCSNECQVRPCLHGGICRDEVDSFVCFCRQDFTGPTCSADLKCSDFPRLIDNGEVRITYPRGSYGYHLPGTRVSYTCRDGYKLNSKRYQTSVIYACQITKRWDANPNTVSCVKKTCPRLRRITNGQMNPIFQEGLRHPVGTVVSFTCSSGYRLTNTLPLLCQDSESWSETQPSCRVIQCPSFTVDNGRLVPQQNAYATGSTVSIECNEGFRLNGINSRSCPESGDWIKEIPRCTVDLQRCPRLMDLVEEGRRCRKPCQSDADCRGALKRCRCDDACGMSCFNPNAECPPLSGIPNGRVTYRERTRKYNSRAQYVCNQGYSLRGESFRSCRSDRKWSGTEAKCINLKKCGQAGETDSIIRQASLGRLLGGNKATRAWPWQAAVMPNNGPTVYQSFKRIFAGGSLINQQWVLTAAHIFDDYADIERLTSTLAVAVGIFERPMPRKPINTTMKVFQPRRIFIHQDFDREDRGARRTNFDHDVALIRIGVALRAIRGGINWVWSTRIPEFNGTIPLSPYVRPICLPCSNTCVPIDKYVDQEETQIIEDGDSEDVKCQKKGRWLVDRYVKESRTRFIVTGFGKWTSSINDTVPIPYRLKEAVQQIQSDASCNEAVERIEAISGIRALYTNQMICVKSPDGSNTVSDTCQGDSGGPLMRQYKNPNTGESCWIQVGIVSFGFRCAHVDEDGFVFPGFYTEVSKIQSWIESTMIDNP